MIRFETIDPESNRAIQVSYSRGYLDDSRVYDIVVVKFSGEYPDGSKGNDEALYMAAKIDFIESLYMPFGVIIDLSTLGYVWGDAIERIFPSQRRIQAMVLGNSCKNAIYSLIELEGEDEDVRAYKQYFFDNIDTAWHYVAEQIHRRYDSDRQDT